MYAIFYTELQRRKKEKVIIKRMKHIEYIIGFVACILIAFTVFDYEQYYNKQEDSNGVITKERNTEDDLTTITRSIISLITVVLGKKLMCLHSSRNPHLLAIPAETQPDQRSQLGPKKRYDSSF